jgi:hypothetical protein
MHRALKALAFSQIQLRPHPYALQEPQPGEALSPEHADAAPDDLLRSGGPKGRNVLTSEGVSLSVLTNGGAAGVC